MPRIETGGANIAPPNAREQPGSTTRQASSNTENTFNSKRSAFDKEVKIGKELTVCKGESQLNSALNNQNTETADNIYSTREQITGIVRQTGTPPCQEGHLYEDIKCDKTPYDRVGEEEVYQNTETVADLNFTGKEFPGLRQGNVSRQKTENGYVSQEDMHRLQQRARLQRLPSGPYTSISSIDDSERPAQEIEKHRPRTASVEIDEAGYVKAEAISKKQELDKAGLQKKNEAPPGATPSSRVLPPIQLDTKSILEKAARDRTWKNTPTYIKSSYTISLTKRNLISAPFKLNIESFLPDDIQRKASRKTGIQKLIGGRIPIQTYFLKGPVLSFTTHLENFEHIYGFVKKGFSAQEAKSQEDTGSGLQQLFTYTSSNVDLLFNEVENLRGAIRAVEAEASEQDKPTHLYIPDCHRAFLLCEAVVAILKSNLRKKMSDTKKALDPRKIFSSMEDGIMSLTTERDSHFLKSLDAEIMRYFGNTYTRHAWLSPRPNEQLERREQLPLLNTTGAQKSYDEINSRARLPTPTHMTQATPFFPKADKTKSVSSGALKSAPVSISDPHKEEQAGSNIATNSGNSNHYISHSEMSRALPQSGDKDKLPSKDQTIEEEVIYLDLL